MQHPRKAKFQALAGLLEIPQDIVLDLPRLTLLGNKQLLVENHRGIVEYSDFLVRINLSQGMVSIRGADLVLCNLQSEQLLLEGTIASVSFDT
jgi:sporulation protein YqfC